MSDGALSSTPNIMFNNNDILLGNMFAQQLPTRTYTSTPLRICNIAGSRNVQPSEIGWQLDASLMTLANIKLGSPMLFGPFGLINRRFTRVDLTTSLVSLGLNYLNNSCDFIFHGWFADGSLSSLEYGVMSNWVNTTGKILIMTCDDSNHDDGCNYFGRPLRQTATVPYRPTVAGAADPLFNGPFGILTSATTYTGSGAQSNFFAAANTTSLAIDPTGNTTLLKNPIGRGFVLFVGDVDLISDSLVSSSNGVQNNNDIILANMFAMLPVGTAPPPSVTTSTASGPTSASTLSTSAPTSAAPTSGVTSATSAGTSASSGATTQILSTVGSTQAGSTESGVSAASSLSVRFGLLCMLIGVLLCRQ
jgi:hypothetical protein